MTHSSAQTAIQTLHEKAVRTAHEYQRCERELLDILQELDRIHGAGALGYSSLFDYCVKALGLSESMAYSLITVARKAVEVPALKASVVAGELTLTNAKRVAPILTVENQERWIEKARQLPRVQLEREIAREFPQEVKQERVKPIAADRVAVQMTISNELFEKLKRIQDLESSRLKRAVSLEEALDVATQTHLTRNDPLAKAQRAAQKSQLTKSVATRSRHSSGQRAPIPAAIQHAVRLRDKSQCTAQTPAGRCTTVRWLHFHHITPVSQGGEHVRDNLTLLCSAHHAREHESVA